jgi:hypothetical protein
VTRREFVDKAKFAAERRLGIPTGWWGTWTDVTNGVVRVTFTRRWWRVSCAGRTVSRHDSRSFAIAKARKVRR